MEYDNIQWCYGDEWFSPSPSICARYPTASFQNTLFSLFSLALTTSMPAPSLHPQSVLFRFQETSKHCNLHVQSHLCVVNSTSASSSLPNIHQKKSQARLWFSLSYQIWYSLLKSDFVLKLLHEHLKYCCCLGQHGLNTDTISETSTWILCIGFLCWWIYSSLIQHDYRASSVMNSLIMTTLVSRSLVYWSPCWRNSSCSLLNSCSFAATFALVMS